MEQQLMDSLRESLLCLLEETLHSHQGVYTNQGTSLLETLSEIDAGLASRRYPGLQETIAGHANHARYYLSNTLEMLRDKGSGDFDVAESWKIQTVTGEEWEELKSNLSTTYQSVMALISNVSVTEVQFALPAMFGLFAHSAYHLGAIRQLKDLNL